MSRLNLDRDQVESCHLLADKIATRTRDFVGRHTSVSVERSMLKLLGVDAPTVLKTLPPEKLDQGIFYWLGRALLSRDVPLSTLVLEMAGEGWSWNHLPEAPLEEIQKITLPLASAALHNIRKPAELRSAYHDVIQDLLLHPQHVKLTLLDQSFSRLLMAYSGLKLEFGSTAETEPFRSYPQTLSSLWINERLASQSGFRQDHVSLCYALKLDVSLEDGFLDEVAQAEIIREVFPYYTVQYHPGTSSSDLASLNDLVSCIVMSPPTLIEERPVLRLARHLSDEISWSPNGKIIRKARSLLEDTHRLLKKIEATGLGKAVEQGLFGSAHEKNLQARTETISSEDALMLRHKHYWNPLLDLLEKKSFAEEGAEESEENNEAASSSSHKKSGRPQRSRRHFKNRRARHPRRAKGNGSQT